MPSSSEFVIGNRNLQTYTLSKRIYQHLSRSGYARLDYRLSNDAIFYLLEANPNPQIAKNEDSADSAAHCGLSYPQLLQKILMLGVSYSAWSDPGLLSSSL